jgi:CRISPR-associated protein Cmr3
MINWYFVCPTDSLFVRGNLAFGEGGEHGYAQMPPPPSLFAGAFRSAILGQDVRVLDEFLAIPADHDGSVHRLSNDALHMSLGTPAAPGAFRIAWLSLAGKRRGTVDQVESLSPLPADLVWTAGEPGKATQGCFERLLPSLLPEGVTSSAALPLGAVLQTRRQVKAEGGRYLTGDGLALHLQGDALPGSEHAVPADRVHRDDPRLGIAIDSARRTAETGRIYTTEGRAFSPVAGSVAPAAESTASFFEETGFLVGIEGLPAAGDKGRLPARGMLRLGGDGRSAEYRRVEFTPPEVPPTLIAGHRRFRLIMRTPGLFRQPGERPVFGWLPPGVEQDAHTGKYLLRGAGFSAQLVCAAIGRRELVSGWDLHKWRPKDALAAVPAGSVYWFDDFSGDAPSLAQWVAGGLRTDADARPDARHAEGWNQAMLALWPQQ